MNAIVRTDEANSMAFLQREFLPSNDTYKTKTLNFVRGNENVTHSAQGETVFWGGNFLFRISEYMQRERKCSFRKLQIFISQTTDFHFVSSHFVSFHFVSSHFVSQTTVSPSSRQRSNFVSHQFNDKIFAFPPKTIPRSQLFFAIMV